MREYDMTMSDMMEAAIKKDEQEKEEAKALQEAYYYHVIAEFYGMCKYFGVEKVMADLAEFKKTVEKPKEEPRIQLL